MAGLPSEPLALDGCTVDLRRRLVHHDDGRTGTLTAREADLLAWLSRKPDQTVSREELLVEVWGYSPDMATRTVDNTVRRLRTKVEADPRQPRHVLTVFGEGYRFAPARAPGIERPSGRVALVALRVSGLAALRGRDEALAERALEVFEACVEAAAEAAGGVVAGPVEALRVAFGEPRGAVALAADLQRALHEADWPGALLRDPAGAAPEGRSGPWRGLRVAMAVALGEGQPVASGYEGPVVEVVDALVQAAHGGQVLLGPATREAVPPASLTLDAIPLGSHPLVPGGAPLPLVQVLPASLAARAFPPPRTAERRQTNLPAEVTSFVGRRRPLQQLRALLAGEARLVTLLGPAGAGKTRLARRLGADRVGALSAEGGGVWFVELAGLREADGVVAAVAEVLGIALDPDAGLRADARQVGRALAVRGPTLVILDNAEQVVVPLAEVLAGWLDAAPEVRFLVTSRAVLGLPGERPLGLGPLDPDEAVALFLDRARAVRADLELDTADLDAVREIAARLDHNPLALELAAVRTRLLAPRHLAARLDARFEALGRGPRDGLAHHSTLREAIDWSWDLLDPVARSVFAQLGVFRRAPDPQAVAAVVEVPAEADLHGLLVDLRDRSLLALVEAADRPGVVRVELLESLRDYAAERLGAGDDAEAVRDRHLAWAVDLGQRCLADLDGPEAAVAVRRLAAAEADLRAAHARALATDPVAACRLAATLDALLAPRGPYEAWLGLLDATLEASTGAGAAARVPVLLARARGRETRGQADGAEADLRQAAREARDGGDQVRVAEVLLALSRWSATRGRPAEAARFLEGADARTTEARTPRLQARIEATRARQVAACGAVGAARQRGEEALRQLEAAGLLGDVAVLLPHLAGWCALDGDPDGARTHLRRALKLARERGDRRLEGRTLTALGILLLEDGDLDPAARHLDLAADLHARVGDRGLVGRALGHRGVVRLEQGRLDEALGDLDRALGLLDEVDATADEGAVLGWRGAVHHRAGRLHAALADVRRGLHRLREAGDRRREGRLAVRASLLLHDLGHPAEARRALVHAAEALERVGDAEGLATLQLVRRLLSGDDVVPPPRARLEARHALGLSTARPT